MDFGVGFLSNNVMLPILDLFYGIVPSYGLAIVALTLVIRFALYPPQRQIDPQYASNACCAAGHAETGKRSPRTL